MKIGTLACAALAFAAPGTSYAATIVQGFSHTVALDRGSIKQFSFGDSITKFDPRLGSLRNVILESTASYRVDLDWEFVGPENMALFQSQGSFQAMVFADPATSLFLLNDYPAESLGLDLLGAGSGHATLQKTQSQKYVAGPGEIEDAIGAGTFTSETGVTFWHFYEALYGPLTYTYRGQSGSLTVTGAYTFVYDPVPEPLTWTAMVGGFALAGSALRFRRKRRDGGKAAARLNPHKA